MPTFNRAHDIVLAVESVLAQTFTDFDVWVIDDGSTDNTAHALKDYRERINYVKTENSGHAAARNRGIMASQGRYLAFLDSDDRWGIDKLERVAREVESASDAGLFYTDVVAVDATRRPLWVQQAPDVYGDAYLRLLCGNFITMSSAVVSRAALDCVGLFDETFRLSPDWDLWLRIARRFPIKRVPYAVTEYCALGVDSQSADPNEEWPEELRRVVEKAIAEDAGRAEPHRRRIAAGLHYAVGRTLLLQGDDGWAARELWQSWRLNPRSWKSALYLGVALVRARRFLPSSARRLLRIPVA